MTTRRCILVAAIAAVVGCDQPSTSTRTMRVGRNTADVYLRSIGDTLNDIPGALDLNLLPAQPILTKTTSSDGEEVLATCTQNPQSPDGTINYLRAASGNARFATLRVQAGDIVRYYVQLDADAAERDIEERTALELRVRRLDSVDPENALILEGGGLDREALVPQRIEIWRYSDKRMDAIRSMLTRYTVDRRPPAGWEPSPDLAALRQVAERTNQWLRNQPASVPWQPEPLLADVAPRVRLPENARSLPAAQAALRRATDPQQLREGDLTEAEARQFEQAIWCRDIGQWARGGATSDLDAAAALFDWTVRNVQLDADEAPSAIDHPWQALAYGHGKAAHRAWVFVELCRQQGIDAVVVRPGADPAAATPAPPASDAAPPLLVSVLIEQEDGSAAPMYLFDPAVGLPLPGPDGAPATLEQLAASPELLRQFDAGDDQPYRLAAEQLQRVDVLLVASPLQLSQAAARLEAALTGENFVRLAAAVRKQAEMLGSRPQVASVSLWAQPFQAVVDEASAPISRRRLAANEFRPFAERPLLWKARVLHFQGHKDIPAAQRKNPLAQPREGHQDALRLYQDPTVRPAENVLAKLEPAKQAVYRAAKAEASYWLGLLSYDRGLFEEDDSAAAREKFEVAASWLGDRTLDREPQGKWAHGARYNLARTFEKLGRLDEAIKLLEETPADDPQRQGNLVRAKRLAALSAGASAADGAADE